MTVCLGMNDRQKRIVHIRTTLKSNNPVQNLMYIPKTIMY